MRLVRPTELENRSDFHTYLKVANKGATCVGIQRNLLQPFGAGRRMLTPSL